MPIRPELRHLYPGRKDWLLIRAAVRERDGDRCRRCGFRNGAWVLREKGRWVEITRRDAAAAKARGLKVVRIICGACHRIPVSLEYADHSLRNLLWLCSGDHLRFDRRAGVHRRTREEAKDSRRPLLVGAVGVRV